MGEHKEEDKEADVSNEGASKDANEI